MSSQINFPISFFGHGSPMNAIADNDYTRKLKLFGRNLAGKPDCIIVISAHWETNGYYYTDAQKPQQIYDMYGFPEELYRVQYQPSGYPQVFDHQTQLSFIHPSSQLAHQNWGLDHGAWSVLNHLRPQADISVVQISLNRKAGVDEHYEFGKKLASLDFSKVWLIGSGNIVHNLRRFSWEENAPIMDWSQSFDQWINKNVLTQNYISIVKDWQKHPSSQMAVPSLEHFLPFIVCLGVASQLNLKANVIFDGIQNASLAMRSYAFS